MEQMKNLIGISGKIGSGKDTVATIIQELYPQYEVKKFAGKLKDIASILTGIPVEKFEDQEFKKTDLGKEWSYVYPDQYYDDGESVMVCMSVRQLLQKLGTDALRDNLHENVWVNALMADYVEKPVNVLEGEGYRLEDTLPNWIITDTRFPNEAKIIEEKDGILLRVERSTCNLGTHPSETALDDFPFEHVIFNNGSMDDLRNEVKKFLESIS
jgi:hypothetical protein